MVRISFLWFTALLSSVLLVVLLSVAQAQPAASITNAVLISETGQPVRLSTYRGKVVFVNVWGSWCTPCLQEMPSIRGL